MLKLGEQNQQTIEHALKDLLNFKKDVDYEQKNL